MKISQVDYYDYDTKARELLSLGVLLGAVAGAGWISLRLTLTSKMPIRIRTCE